MPISQDVNLKYPLSIQKQLGWLFFFLAFPLINVGVSITFFIFIFIIYNIIAAGKFGSPFAIKDFTDKTILNYASKIKTSR